MCTRARRLVLSPFGLVVSPFRFTHTCQPRSTRYPRCIQFGRGFSEYGIAQRKLDGELFLGSKHLNTSFEAGTASHNKLRAFRSPSSPFLTYSMSIETFPKSRYWR